MLSKQEAIIGRLKEDLKILHIDDNAMFTSVFSKLLELHGHECDVIDNGKNALEMIIKNNYDAIILDLQIPEFSGYDIVDELCKIGVISSQNIIVLSGFLPSENKVESLIKKGVKVCLEKPIDIGKFNSILSSLVIAV